MACGCQSTQQSGAIAAPQNYEAVPAAAGTTRQIFATQGEAEMYVAQNGGGHTRPTDQPVSVTAAA